jgi:hypothetical protein
VEGSPAEPGQDMTSDTVSACPDWQETLDDLAKLYGATTTTLFPIPIPSRPVKSGSSSPRLRQRYVRKVRTWTTAVHYLVLLNGLNEGRCNPVHRDRERLRGHDEVRTLAAHDLIVSRILREASLFAKCRRQLVTGGDQLTSVSNIVRGIIVSEQGYARLARTRSQVALCADAVAEPDNENFVSLLEALPPSESLFYSTEDNAIDWRGKSSVILEELTQQYGFVGGTLDEYVKYFHRADLPSSMGYWEPYDQVKAISGFSVITNKMWEGPTQTFDGMPVQLSFSGRQVQGGSGDGRRGSFDQSPFSRERF